MAPRSSRPPRQLALFDRSGEEPEDTHTTPEDASSACNHWDYCPNCGERLHNQGCKYRCPRCHYFMSCSDFD